MSDLANVPVRRRAGTPPANSGRIAGNFVVLAAGEVVAKLASFFAFTYLGRTLGPQQYGSLEFTAAVMVFFALPGDFGLSVYGAREVSQNRDRSFRLLGAIIRLRFMLALVSFGLLAGVVWWLPKPFEVKQLLMCYGLSLLLLPLGLQWFFQGHDRMNWVAASSVARWGVFAALVLGFARKDRPLFVVGLFECVAVAAMAAVCVAGALTWFRGGAAAVAPADETVRPHLREAAPIGLTELTWALLWYFTTVRLGFVVSDDSLGWFGASHRVVLALHTFVWLYFFNLLPSFSRLVHEDEGALRRLVALSTRIAAWSSIFVAFVVTTLSAEFLSLAYGRDFARGGPILSVLVWMLPVAMLSGHYRYLLIACGLQKQLFYVLSAAALIAALLAFELSRHFGAKGAAAGLVAAVCVEFGLARWYAGCRVWGIGFLRHLGRPVAALATSAAVFLALRGRENWLAAVVAAHVYLGFVAVCERKEIRRLYRSIAGREAFGLPGAGE